MDTINVVLEHPFVTRAKKLKNFKGSPMVTSKDEEQPSQGYLMKRSSFQDYVDLANSRYYNNN